MEDGTTFLDLELDQIEPAFVAMGEPAFRARQVSDGIYRRLLQSYAEMTDLPIALRQRLTNELPIGLGQEVARQEGTGGVIKGLLLFPPHATAECVLLPYSFGTSACLSSQVGCRQGCLFCATGASGFTRSLATGEIMAQYLYLARAAGGRRVSRIVMMGAGEPLDNYEAVVKFLRRLHDPRTFDVSYRRMTVSTVGLVPQMLRLKDEGIPVTLALSLHATTDEVRSLLIPENRRYPVREILAAADAYFQATGRRLTYEFILISGLNDGLDEARRLAAIVRDHPGHVNLIPLNPVPGFPYDAPTRERVRAFRKELLARGVPATVRRTLGQDVDAACGQLRRRFDKKGDAVALLRGVRPWTRPHA